MQMQRPPNFISNDSLKYLFMTYSCPKEPHWIQQEEELITWVDKYKDLINYLLLQTAYWGSYFWDFIPIIYLP